MEVVRTPEEVIWRKLGWQEPDPLDGPELTPFQDQSFTFERRQYEDVLQSLRSKYAERRSPAGVVRNAFRRVFRRG